MDDNTGYNIVPGSLRRTGKKKHPGNAAFLLILLISLLLSAVTPERLAGETEEKKDKKKQTQSSETAESKKKLEPKPKAKPLPTSEPVPKSEPVSKSEHKQYKQTIIAGEPKKYTGEPGDFIFQEADIKNVLLFFGKTYKLNILIDPGVSGKVTIRLVNVPWDQALDLILRQHGLAMIKNGNLITAKELNQN
jgi:type II secretory pathway component HofQ